MTDTTLNVDLEKQMIEQLADLEHEQWMAWSKEILKRMETTMQTNNGLIAFSMGQKQRWTSNWIPYAELSEDTKEHDRKWARKVLAIVNEGYSFCYQKGLEKGKTAENERLTADLNAHLSGIAGHDTNCSFCALKQAGRDEDKITKKVKTLGLNQDGIFVTLLENPCSRGHKSALKFLDDGNVACLACEVMKPKERKKLVIAELKKLCSELNQEWYANVQVIKQKDEKIAALEADLRSSKATIGCLSKEKEALEAENARLRQGAEALFRVIPIINEIQHNHRWYLQRGGLLPYDWNDYMGKQLNRLEKEMRAIEIAKKALEG